MFSPHRIAGSLALASLIFAVGCGGHQSANEATVATKSIEDRFTIKVGARTVQFDRIDPELSREMFIRHALVEADWETRHAFFAANLGALDEVAEREDRARRRDIRIDDESLFALYDERIPEDVRSNSNFFYEELVRILAEGRAESLGL